MKTQKGITLIALIITIIVMLILVGVSVSVALNTGLFKTAQGAAKNTEGARVNETKLSNGTVNIGGEEVDISNIENINAALEKQKLKEQGYTHKVTFTYGEDSFECNINEDTTFNQLASQSNNISIDEDGYVKIFGKYAAYNEFRAFSYDDDGDEIEESYTDSVYDSYRLLGTNKVYDYIFVGNTAENSEAWGNEESVFIHYIVVNDSAEDFMNCYPWVDDTNVYITVSTV